MRVLILAPHPDDEINVAGSMIVSLSRKGAEIFAAYSTNGDFEQSAEVRAAEAIESLKILGVDSDHVIWLGYGDTYNGTGKPHVFYAETPMQSRAGHSSTYAPRGFKPWRQSTYTRANFFADLKSLILELRADVIFCVDLDFHADHRALSLAFDRIMGEILHCEEYRPTVFKKLAYATAFTAEQDLHCDCLLPTKRPHLGLEAYDFELIDKFFYDWESRIRFPILPQYRKPLLKGNPIARAVFAHKSQRIQRNALAIINADEVFFERRTDSITFRAKVSASSGNADAVCDFRILDLIDINESPPRFGNFAWTPSKDDRERRLTFHWNSPQSVRLIKIYGVLNGSVDKLRISFDNSMSLECRVERGGLPTVIELPTPIEITRAEFRILSADGEFGIGEIEMFSTIEPKRAIQPPATIDCDEQRPSLLQVLRLRFRQLLERIYIHWIRRKH